MRSVCLYCLLLCSVFAIVGCTTGESYVQTGYDFSKLEKVAVVSIEGPISGAARNQIADFFNMELLKKGYGPIERSQVEALLEEQKFQAKEVTSPEGIARAGRILNVPTVMVVNIPNFRDDISMTAKLLDVEDGSILWMGSGSGRTGSLLSTIAGAAGGAAAGAAVAGEDKETIGAVAGGILGGVAGQALSPQKAQKAQEIIKKLCESLPYRVGPNK